MSQPPRLYLDATETYWSGVRAGIQRVVLNLAQRRDQIGKVTGTECVPIIIGQRSVLDGTPLLSVRSGERPETTSDRYSRKLALQGRLLLQRALPTGSIPFRAMQTIWRIFRAPIVARADRKALQWELTQPELEFHPGDALVLTDSFWGRWGSRSVTMAARLASQRVPIVLVIYDLFPLTRPDFFEPEVVAPFKRYFPQALKVCSGIVTISESMAQEVRDYLKAHHSAVAGTPVVAFQLGQDIRGSGPSPARPVRPHIAELATNHRYYLAVGTLEPRKGYRALLEAFAERWRWDTSLTLCIVGKIGWRCRDELRLIRRSPELSKRLFFLNDVTDGELSHLYQHCRAVVLPSLAEGFGLPLAEAMGAGARIIANDIPIFREVGGDYPLYYPQAPDRLNAAIDEMERRIGTGWSPALRTWQSWDQAAVQFAEAVKNILGQSHVSV